MPTAGRPQRVLLVCDAYPAYPTEPGADSADQKVRAWFTMGAAVLVLAGNPQPPGTLPSGYVETEEIWVEGVTVYQVRFAPPVRRQVAGRHGAESSLRLVLEGTLRQYRPDLVCVVLGPIFGAIPLRKAAEHGIAVEIVDNLSILRNADVTRRQRRGRRASSVRAQGHSQSDSGDPGAGRKSRLRLTRILRKVERR